MGAGRRFFGETQAYFSLWLGECASEGGRVGGMHMGAPVRTVRTLGLCTVQE